MLAGQFMKISLTWSLEFGKGNVLRVPGVVQAKLQPRCPCGSSLAGSHLRSACWCVGQGALLFLSWGGLKGTWDMYIYRIRGQNEFDL